MEDSNPDYLSVCGAFEKHARKYCVMVMHYDRTTGDYISTKCSHPLSEKAAHALVRSWGAALKLEIR